MNSHRLTESESTVEFQFFNHLEKIFVYFNLNDFRMNFFDRYLIIMVNYVNIDFLSHCYEERYVTHVYRKVDYFTLIYNQFDVN